MSQSTITSFFNSRKRPASDDIVSSKNKIAHVDHTSASGIKSARKCIISKKNVLSSQRDLLSPSSKEIIVEQLKKLEKIEHISRDSQAADQSSTTNAFAKKLNASNVKNQQPPKSETTSSLTSARKELSLGDIRKKLAGSSRLAELKASAERISKGIQQLKDSTEKKNLKEFRSIDVEVPSR